MVNGSYPFNIGYTLVAFNLVFAFAILFRESFDSPHSQGSLSVDWMVLWFCIAMVPWFGGSGSLSAPIAIDLSTTSFEFSPCHAFNSLLFFVWHVTWFGLWTILKMFHFFPQIVISCQGRFSFLPFFRHSLLVEKQCISPDPQKELIVHGL